MSSETQNKDWIGYVLTGFFVALSVYAYFGSLVRMVVGLVLVLGPSIVFGFYKRTLAFRFPSIAAWLWIGYPALLVGGWFLNATIYEKFGSARPGALFEKPNYQARVMVYAFPTGLESQKQRVPALVKAYFEESVEGDRTISERVYWLRHLAFPGGRFVRFTDSGWSLRLREQVGLMDDQGKSWRIELTSELAK